MSIDDPAETVDAEAAMVAGEALGGKAVLVNSKGEVYDSLLGAEKVTITRQKLF